MQTLQMTDTNMLLIGNYYSGLQCNMNGSMNEMKIQFETNNLGSDTKTPQL